MHGSSRRPDLAAHCPGCTFPIAFDAAELAAVEVPEADDVMCAFCGTVTARQRLASEAYRVD